MADRIETVAWLSWSPVKLTGRSRKSRLHRHAIGTDKTLCGARIPYGRGGAAFGYQTPFRNVAGSVKCVRCFPSGAVSEGTDG